MEASFSYIAFSILLILSIKLLVSSVSNRGNNLPPSPPALPIIGHLYLFKKKPLHRALARLSASRGPILFLRFGSRPVLVVSSASLAEECFTKNDVAFASRPQLPGIKHISYNYKAVAAAPYGPHWRNIRRIATVEVLSAHRLNSFSDVRASEVRAMVRELVKDSAAPGGNLRKVEIRSRLFGLSLNVIMSMVAGRRFYEDEGSESEEAKWFREMVEFSFSLAGASNIQDFLPVMKWFDFRGLNKKLVRFGEQRDDFLQGLIEEHRRESGGEEKKRTMIGELLAMQKSDPEYYTDEIIKALIIIAFVYMAIQRERTLSITIKPGHGEAVIWRLEHHRCKFYTYNYTSSSHMDEDLVKKSATKCMRLPSLITGLGQLYGALPQHTEYIFPDSNM